jgi:hypothetical protein
MDCMVSTKHQVEGSNSLRHNLNVETKNIMCFQYIVRCNTKHVVKILDPHSGKLLILLYVLTKLQKKSLVKAYYYSLSLGFTFT